MKKILLFASITFSLNASAQNIANGGNHSLFLCNDGTVKSCGENSHGQLGNNTMTDENNPITVNGLTGIIALAGGNEQSFALKNDGTVWGWGNNFFGAIGDGTTTDQLIPVAVNNLTGISKIAGGYLHSLALKNDGTVWTWGRNNFGQLGDGTTSDNTAPVQVSGLTGIVAIAGGYLHSIALKNDGTVWAWGKNDYGQLGDGTLVNKSIAVQVSVLTNIVSIANGFGNHSLALKSDGTVWSWGYNVLGQLGDGTTNTTGCYCKSTPVQVSSLTGISSIARGLMHSVAVKSDETVWSWGANMTGGLGDGTTTNRSTPVQASNLTGIVAAECGEYHTLTLKNDNTVWSFGNNAAGQLGNGSNTNSSVPVQVTGLCLVTSINENNEQPSVSIYPNPSTGKFLILISVPIAIGITSESLQLKVTDILGKEVYSEMLQSATANHTMDLSHLQNGIYFLYGNNVEVQKIIISR